MRAYQGGSVTIADAGAAAHEHVFAGDIRIGVVGDCRELVGAFKGFSVQDSMSSSTWRKAMMRERIFLVARP